MAGDDGDWLCLRGVQHAFVVSAWEEVGATSHWASEVFCATCGTTATRATGSSDWQWYPPDDVGQG